MATYGGVTKSASIKIEGGHFRIADPAFDTGEHVGMRPEWHETKCCH